MATGSYALRVRKMAFYAVLVLVFILNLVALEYVYKLRSSFDIPHTSYLNAPPEGTRETTSIDPKLALYSFYVSVCTLMVSIIGTASAILLGWRADRRQARETELKIQQLELQLAEARAKVVAPANLSPPN